MMSNLNKFEHVWKSDPVQGPGSCTEEGGQGPVQRATRIPFGQRARHD